MRSRMWLRVQHSSGEHVSCYIEALYTGDRYFPGDFANEVKRLDGYTTTNLQVSYNIGGLTLALRVNNVFDREFSDSGSIYTFYDPTTFEPTNVGSYFPAPGRNGWLTASYHFD